MIDLRKTMSVDAPTSAIHYVSDAEGKPVSVIVPIDLWREIQQELRSERETAYLLANPAMKKRLLEAKERESL